MQERVEQMGVWTVTVLVAVVVIAYSLWASYLLKSHSTVAGVNMPAKELTLK